MHDQKWTLLLLPDLCAISRLDAAEPIPAWAFTSGFVSITRGGDELSIICREAAVPAGVRCARGWRCLRVAGTLDFSQVGVLASLLVTLAQAGVSVFALSTFDTDYLLLQQTDLETAVESLVTAGHTVLPEGEA